MIKIEEVNRYDSIFKSTIVSIVFNYLKEKYEKTTFDREFNLLKGFAFKSSNYVPNGKSIVRVSDINPNGKIISNDFKKITANENLYGGYNLEENDVLLVMIGGSLGKIGIVDKTILPAYLNQNMWKVSSIKPLSSCYVSYLLNYVVNDELELRSMSYQFIKTKALKSASIPKIDNNTGVEIGLFLNQYFNFEKTTVPSFLSNEIYSLINKIRKIYNAIYSLNTNEIQTQKKLISKLKQAILQEAIQGKLTQEWREQNPNIEPASELLERIKAEKQQLIKDKKIRKEKNSPPMTEEEILFKIPESWVWSRVGNITNVGTGATPLTSNKSYYSNGNIPWITSSATGNLFVEKPENFITEKALNETNCNLNPEGTLVVAMYGQGKTRGQITELMFESATNQACATIQPYLKEVENRRFIKLYFQNIYLEIRKLAQGGAQPNLNMGKIKNTIIPFPPLEEQKAIVVKVETLMQKCSALEQEITQSEQHANMLMQAVLKEAFESKTENTEEYANA